MSCLDIGVTKKLGDGVEVCSVCKCEGRKGMACDMECDVLVNASFLYNNLEADICIARLIWKIWEYSLALLCFALLREKCEGVLGEWNGDKLLNICNFDIQSQHFTNANSLRSVVKTFRKGGACLRFLFFYCTRICLFHLLFGSIAFPGVRP